MLSGEVQSSKSLEKLVGAGTLFEDGCHSSDAGAGVVDGVPEFERVVVLMLLGIYVSGLKGLWDLTMKSSWCCSSTCVGS